MKLCHYSLYLVRFTKFFWNDEILLHSFLKTNLVQVPSQSTTCIFQFVFNPLVYSMVILRVKTSTDDDRILYLT